MIDRVLRRIGLMRISQMPYDSLDVEWKIHEPVRVDIGFKNGQRVAGYVDPWYPNKSPFARVVNGD